MALEDMTFNSIYSVNDNNTVIDSINNENNTTLEGINYNGTEFIECLNDIYYNLNCQINALNEEFNKCCKHNQEEFDRLSTDEEDNDFLQLITEHNINCFNKKAMIEYNRSLLAINNLYLQYMKDSALVVKSLKDFISQKKDEYFVNNDDSSLNYYKKEISKADNGWVYIVDPNNK